MVSTAEGIELITAETGRIKAYLRGTGPDQWGLDSPCEGWTVGDVIGHLGWAAEFFRCNLPRPVGHHLSPSGTTRDWDGATRRASGLHRPYGQGI